MQSYFERWKVHYKLSDLSLKDSSDSSNHILEVNGLPWTIAERCRSEPAVLFSMLCQHASKYTQYACSIPKTPKHVQNEQNSDHSNTLDVMPDQMLDLLNSRACRSAIMFNDVLTRVDCKSLVAKLSECTVPFQCAHGRPSMTVLTVIQTVSDIDRSTSKRTDSRAPTRYVSVQPAGSETKTATRPSSAGKRILSGLYATSKEDHHVINELNQMDESTPFGIVYRVWSEQASQPSDSYTDLLVMQGSS